MDIDLDADAYTFATTYANAKGIPLGAAISELLRRAEQASQSSAYATLPSTTRT